MQELHWCTGVTEMIPVELVILITAQKEKERVLKNNKAYNYKIKPAN